MVLLSSKLSSPLYCNAGFLIVSYYWFSLVAQLRNLSDPSTVCTTRLDLSPCEKRFSLAGHAVALGNDAFKMAATLFTVLIVIFS